MLCPSCNAPNRDDAKFCKKCGQPLRVEATKIPEAAAVSHGRYLLDGLLRTGIKDRAALINIAQVLDLVIRLL